MKICVDRLWVQLLFNRLRFFFLVLEWKHWISSCIFVLSAIKHCSHGSSRTEMSGKGWILKLKAKEMPGVLISFENADVQAMLASLACWPSVILHMFASRVTWLPEWDLRVWHSISSKPDQTKAVNTPLITTTLQLENALHRAHWGTCWGHPANSVSFS